jgi:NlpC/P60 family
MKNLFLVSVALGILSGTTLRTKAQSSVNSEQVNNPGVQNRPVKFIEGIEIKTGSGIAEAPVKRIAVKADLIPSVKEEVSAIESFTTLQFKYAQLLDIDVESLTGKALYTEIEKWWGTRYKYGGASGNGIDCSAYTSTLVHNVYGPVLSRTARDQYAECTKLKKAEMQQGDLVFFKTKRGVSHVGLYLGNGYFTHASSGIGVTISNLAETYWNKKYFSGGRINTSAKVE